MKKINDELIINFFHGWNDNLLKDSLEIKVMALGHLKGIMYSLELSKRSLD